MTFRVYSLGYICTERTKPFGKHTYTIHSILFFFIIIIAVYWTLLRLNRARFQTSVSTTQHTWSCLNDKRQWRRFTESAIREGTCFLFHFILIYIHMCILLIYLLLTSTVAKLSHFHTQNERSISLHLLSAFETRIIIIFFWFFFQILIKRCQKKALAIIYSCILNLKIWNTDVS